MSSFQIIAQIRARLQERRAQQCGCFCNSNNCPFTEFTKQMEVVNEDIEYLLARLRSTAIDLGCTDSDLEEMGIK